MFSVFGKILPAFAELLDLRWSTIDLVLVFLAVLVAHNSVFTLISPKIAAVSVDSLFFACQQL